MLGVPECWRVAAWPSAQQCCSRRPADHLPSDFATSRRGERMEKCKGREKRRRRGGDSWRRESKLEAPPMVPCGVRRYGVWLPVGPLLGCCGLSPAKLGCGWRWSRERGVNTVEYCILQRISYFGLGAAAPSRTYMDPPVVVRAQAAQN
jgi:hypothetical protein